MAHGFKPLGRAIRPPVSAGIAASSIYRRPTSAAASRSNSTASFATPLSSSTATTSAKFQRLRALPLRRHRFRPTTARRTCVLVRVDATLGDGWFYEGAGIYRHVWLTKTNPVHVPQWGTLSLHGDTGRGALVASLPKSTMNRDAARECRVVSNIVDPAGNAVATRRLAPLSGARRWTRRNFEQTQRCLRRRCGQWKTPYLSSGDHGGIGRFGCRYL